MLFGQRPVFSAQSSAPDFQRPILVNSAIDRPDDVFPAPANIFVEPERVLAHQLGGQGGIAVLDCLDDAIAELDSDLEASRGA